MTILAWYILSVAASFVIISLEMFVALDHETVPITVPCIVITLIISMIPVVNLIIALFATVVLIHHCTSRKNLPE